MKITRLVLATWIKEAMAVSSKLLPDRDKVQAVVNRALKLAPRLSGLAMEDAITLIMLVKAWLSKSYTAVPKETLLKALAALLYFVNPGDILPDPIPGGLIDDAAVLAWIIRSIQGELEQFRKWKSECQQDGFDRDEQGKSSEPSVPA